MEGKARVDGRVKWAAVIVDGFDFGSREVPVVEGQVVQACDERSESRKGLE